LSSLGTMYVNILADTTQFQRSMQRLGTTLSNAGDKIKNVGKTLSAALTLPIAGLGIAAVKTASDFEKLKTQLNVLTGSAEKGAETFEKLLKFSARTPFQMKDLLRATTTMMGFGVSVEDSLDYLKLLGDVSAGAGGDLQGIALAFSQVAGAGRLMGQDLNQMINNNVPLIKLLADSMNVAEGEVKDLVSEGEVGFQEVVKALRLATEEGGMFENAMAQLSTTMAGLASTLFDNVNIALGELGKEIIQVFDLKGLLDKFINGIRFLTNAFKALSPATKKVLIIFTTLVAVIPPLLVAFGALVSLGSGLVAFLEAITIEGVAVAGALSYLSTISAILVTSFATLFAKSKDFRNSLLKNIKDAVNGIETIVKMNLPKIKAIFKETLNTINIFWKEHGEEIKRFVRLAYKTAVFIVKEAWQAIAIIIPPILDSIQRVVKIFGMIVEKDWDGIWEQIQHITQNAAVVLYAIGAKLLNTLVSVFSVTSRELLSIFKELWEDKKAIFLSFASWFINKMVAFGEKILQAVISGIEQNIGNMINSIKKIGTTILEGLKIAITGGDLKDFMKKQGHTMVSGIKNGLDVDWTQGLKLRMNNVKIQVEKLSNDVKKSAEKNLSETRFFAKIKELGKKVTTDFAGAVSNNKSSVAEAGKEVAETIAKALAWARSLTQLEFDKLEMSFETFKTTMDSAKDKIKILAKELEALKEKFKVQKTFVDTLSVAYNKMKIEKGENADETRKLWLELEKEKLQMQGIQNAVANVTKEYMKANSVLKDFIEENDKLYKRVGKSNIYTEVDTSTATRNAYKEYQNTNRDAINKISRERGVDLGVATAMLASQRGENEFGGVSTGNITLGGKSLSELSGKSTTVVNVTGNNIMNDRDADRLGDMLVNKLKVAGVR